MNEAPYNWQGIRLGDAFKFTQISNSSSASFGGSSRLAPDLYRYPRRDILALEVVSHVTTQD